ncbi:hypothetical protein ACP70R_004000 [Stipagrostis hirtigluma subsp. patula]
MALLEVLASYIQNIMTEMMTEELHMLLGVSGEIDRMAEKLRDLKNFLADADKRNITDQTVQEWVKKLRVAMYDASDIIDLCHLRATERDGPHRDAGCLNPLLFCLRNPLHAHDIGSRIKNLNQRLDDIKRSSVDFGFNNLSFYEDGSRQVASSRLARRETSAELDESSVVGEKIEEDTRNIVEMLTKGGETGHDVNRIMVFAIVGVGGIGKTTLAQKIMNNEVIQQEFMKKIWLSVNQKFSDSDLLGRAIVEAGGDQQANGRTRGALERTLKDILNGCKTLLVMDDVWDSKAWEEVLKTPLIKTLAGGSRVLITTRHDTVARGMKAMEPYHHIDKLQPEDAWFLLKKQIVGNENDEHQVDMLKDIGMRIIAKCDYLPLAVKVMGGVLRQKNTRRWDWEKVLNDSLWSVSQMPEDLNYAIYLSYQDLHPILKSCFLHFARLPKNRLFSLHDIVGMWIGEGFIHGNSDDLEELGREYYNELILRNIIEPDTRYLDGNVCKMHDVVRWFAQYVARDEALVVHSRETGITSKLNSQKFIRLTLEVMEGSETSELEWSSLHAQKSLRTLISVGHIKIKESDSLVAFSSVRTLHISYADCDALVGSLYQLKHLRYLCLDCTNVSRLPENIVKLKFLQHINLGGCKSLVKLPNGIAELRQLRFLNIAGTSINNIPRGWGGLTNLRKLYGFPAHMDGDWCSLEELGPLSQLTVLEISGLERLSSSSFATKARLDKKARLSHLCLFCTSMLGDGGRLVREEASIFGEEQQRVEEVFDELYPPFSLQNFNIRGYFGRRLPRWMRTTAEPFCSLRILTIEDLPCCTELPDGLCQLPCLEHLQIDNAPAIKHVGSDFLQPYHHRRGRSQVAAVFPMLLKLYFREMVEWEEWEWEEQVKAMPVLEMLHLERCKLRWVPPGLSFHAGALKELHVYRVKQLSSLENFGSVVLLLVWESPDLKWISNMPKLQKLIIDKCPKVKVLEGVPALQRLELKDYSMETLPTYLQAVNPRYLQLDCTLRLLTSIAEGKSSPEWGKISHIQQVKAYTSPRGFPRKWYVLYTRVPFSFETNISSSAIAEGRMDRAWLPTFTCPIEEEWPVGRPYAEKRQPLCLRFRWIAQRHLVDWLREVCLHCDEASGYATSSDQWTDAAAQYPYTTCEKSEMGYYTARNRMKGQ